MRDDATGPIRNQLPLREEDAHLRDYLKVVLRRGPILLVTLAAVFVGTALTTFSTTPVYQSETLLRIKAGTRSTGLLGELAAVTQANPVETEIEVLKTHLLAREVVREQKLDLTVSVPNGPWRRILRMAGLARPPGDFAPDSLAIEVPPALLGVPLDLAFGPDGMTWSLFRDGVLLAQGRAGAEVTGADGLRMTVGRDKPLTGGGTCVVVKHSPEAVAESLSQRLRVSLVGRNTEVIRMTFTDTDPKRASRILDAFNRLYIEKDIADKSKEATATLEFIREQSVLAKARLDRAEEALNAYQAKTGVVALSQEAQLLVQRISDLEVELARLQVTRSGLQQVTRAIADDATLNPAGVGALGIASPELASLMGGYLTLGQKRADLLRDYTPDNPLVKGLDAQMSLAAEQVRLTAGAILGATIMREKSVDEVLAVYRAQLAKLPQIEQDLARLQKDVLIQEKTWSFLAEKEQNTQIVRASTVSNIRVVDPPVTIPYPVRPRVAQNLILGLLLGLLLGVGFAFFAEYIDDTIKDMEDLGRRFRGACYGVIPFVREAHERRKAKQSHLVIEQKRSPVTEAFRSLRTNVLLSRADTPPQVITVTSAGMGEGKTFIAVNLASVSALTGKRTIYLDCDMRKPQGHVVFGIENDAGLSSYLAGQAELHQVVKRSPVDNLDVVTSGPIPPNPSEMLGSARMAALLERLKGEYDLILLDTPPITLVADPLITAKLSELALVVVRSGVTPASALKGAMEQLQAVQVTSSGVVLNAVRRTRLGRYGYRYDRYGYGYGYGHYYGQNEKRSE
jgi:tyrosine-protein kinase Etk/Wzc